jgi:hypothetical protein
MKFRRKAGNSTWFDARFRPTRPAATHAKARSAARAMITCEITQYGLPQNGDLELHGRIGRDHPRQS